MNPTAPPAGRRILELDGLRAFSVLFVIVCHYTVAGTLVFPAAVLPVIYGLGPFGVQIFFVISGFIITRLQIEEHAARGSVSLKTFYIRRFFRIIPAYWTYLAVAVALSFAGEISIHPGSFFKCLFFLSDINQRHTDWFIGHSWSLSVEEQYYIFLPFFLWIVLRGNPRSLLLAVSVLYVFTTYAPKLARLSPALGSLDLLHQFKFILAGVFLALVWPRVKDFFTGVPLLVPLILLALEFARPCFTGLGHVGWERLTDPVEALGIALLIGWTLQNPRPVALLRWAPVQWLGQCSYSIYLWQQLFTARPENYHLVRLSHLPLGLLIFVCAGLSYHFIERRSIALGRELTSRKIPSTPRSPPPSPAPSAAETPA